MKLPEKFVGKAIALVCSEEDGVARLLVQANITPDMSYGEAIAVNGEDCPDYDNDRDVYYHVSDDGSRFYNSARILESADTLVPPSTEVLRKTCMAYVAPLLGKVHADDVTWAINIITNPVWLHKAYNEVGGNVEEAQKLAIEQAFAGYI